MAFCGKCGAKNKDGAMFCTQCGAALNTVSGGGGHGRVSELRKKNRDRNVGMIAAIVAAVAVVAVGIFLFGGRSYKATVKRFVNATFEADAEAMLKLIPKKMVDNLLEEEGYDDDELDDMVDEMNEYFQDQMDSLDKYLGEGWEVSYEILAAEKLTGDDLDDIKERYEDADVKVSAAKEIEIELTIKTDEMENSDTTDLYVVKVGRSWYLDAVSMGGLL